MGPDGGGMLRDIEGVLRGAPRKVVLQR
jgi:hypothetical protein